MTTKEILKANNLWPEIRWEIKSPGTLFLSCTKYEIRMERCSLNMEWLYLYHGDTRVSSDVSLESIKYSARKHMVKLLEMGIDP